MGFWAHFALDSTPHCRDTLTDHCCSGRRRAAEAQQPSQRMGPAVEEEAPKVDVLVEDGLRKVRQRAGAGLGAAACRRRWPRPPAFPTHARLPAARSFLLQAINGYTWPGIEFGEPPSCKYSFFEVRQDELGSQPGAAGGGAPQA